jgi:hypothetical protein
MLWPGVIYLAAATIQCVTRLRKLPGVCHGQGERSEAFCIVAALQFNIRENHTIAAQPTIQAKLLGYGFSRDSRIVQYASI